MRVTPNKNRLVQVRRTGGRKLFDKRRKEVFLEWFAATCNVRLSAGKAGVCDKTVYKHLAKDEAFFEAFGRALQLGYVRLEARILQEAHGADVRPTPAPPCQGGEQLEVRVLDDQLAEEHFDPQLAIQLLREHKRHLPGSADTRKAGAVPRGATAKEIADALTKRLKAFAVRVEREKPPVPARPRDADESPSPARGEGAG